MLVLLGIIAAVAGVGSRDEHSYQYGYQYIGPSAAAFLSAGVEGKEYACNQAYEMVAGLPDGNSDRRGSLRVEGRHRWLPRQAWQMKKRSFAETINHGGLYRARPG